MSFVDLTIIIPTLNRPKAVVANVRSLIHSCSGVSGVTIYVSENCSEQNLRISDGAWTELVHLGDSAGVCLRLVRRENRIPMGQHFALLSREVQTSWQMWMGDDDCLAEDYVKQALVAMRPEGERADLRAIFSRFFTCSDVEFFRYCENFRKILPRKHEKEIIHDINKSDGFLRKARTLCGLTLRGHQLSGLCFHRSVIENTSSRINTSNLYPFITWMGQAAASGAVLEMQDLSIAVTSNTQKHFSYGKDGLQPDIVEAVRAVKTGNYFLDVAFVCMVAASKRVLWRMTRTSSSSFGILWNYACLVGDFRMTKLAWLCGFLRLAMLQIKRAGG